MSEKPSWLDDVQWNEDGLVIAVTQEYRDKQVLTVAWMNEESLLLSLEEQRAVYWSRSRQKIWRKGEESGHVQQLHNIFLDCDGDALLLLVEQVGNIACHTGRKTCFYRELSNSSWNSVYDVLKSPQEMYQTPKKS